METLMTPDARKILLSLISEYGNCLTRIEGEKDMIKFIEAKAVTECGITTKAFKIVATAHHKDQVSTVLDELNRQVDLLDEIRSIPDYTAQFRQTTASVELGVV
jgi:hypothetical protein